PSATPPLLHPFPTRRSSDLLHHDHRAAHDAHSGGLEGLELLLGSATRTRDDRPGVTHPAALGGSLASHEAGHRLADVLVDVLGGDRKSTRLNSSHVKISYAV